jgi:hypothetical protein
MKLPISLCLFSFLFMSAALAQSGQLPLGTVNASPMLSCPAGYFPGAKCFQAVVSCPGTADIQATYGFVNPAGTPRGTIVFFNGKGGTQTYGSGGRNGPSYAAKYLQDGYRVVQSAWATDWENTGIPSTLSIKTAACRPATLLNHFFTNIYDQNGGMCAQGVSAGAGALGYALAWYGSANYLDKAELISGPVFSDIEKGCMEPDATTVTVCPTHQFGCIGASWRDNPTYVIGTIDTVSAWTGQSCQQGKRTSNKSNNSWKAMSIVDGTLDASFSYPQTSMAAWLCSNGQNNSAAEGQYFYQNFTSVGQVPSYSVTRIDGCAGAEVVEAGTTPSGVNGFVAVTSDMEDSVAGCIKRH